MSFFDCIRRCISSLKKYLEPIRKPIIEKVNGGAMSFPQGVSGNPSVHGIHGFPINTFRERQAGFSDRPLIV